MEFSHGDYLLNSGSNVFSPCILSNNLFKILKNRYLIGY
ncbi:hypothetical protein C943_01380 [Mariniradius saccharolyticus AK6]|uniref:Uncharacterized protein n=1 Tax=Mariniradius saccharolyticus AK6 TaxID=1239962 RepID=M7XBW4_9BACT|nr:hypothetical protein C943_01380 [Mariniradius saccharolyticus AK6]